MCELGSVLVQFVMTLYMGRTYKRKFYLQEGSTSSLDPSEQFEMIASGQSFDKTPETEVCFYYIVY